MQEYIISTEEVTELLAVKLTDDLRGKITAKMREFALHIPAEIVTPANVSLDAITASSMLVEIALVINRHAMAENFSQAANTTEQ